MTNPGMVAMKGELMKYLDAIEYCVEQLSKIPKTKHINKETGNAEALKSKIERWHKNETGRNDSLPLGAVLVAARVLGFQCEQISGTSNFYMNLSNSKRVNGEWLRG